MTVYVVGQIKITDQDSYNKYLSRFMDVFNKFKGTVLASDDHPFLLEGEWETKKLVLMSFPDKKSFRAWAESPEYIEISKDRLAGSTAVIILAKGI